MKVLGIIDLSGDLQLLFFFLDLVLCPVTDADSTSTGPHFLSALTLIYLLFHGIKSDILIGWESDCSSGIHHVCLRLFEIHQPSKVALIQRQVTTTTVVNKTW